MLTCHMLYVGGLIQLNGRLTVWKLSDDVFSIRSQIKELDLFQSEQVAKCNLHLQMVMFADLSEEN